jgi:hypothetical protein
MTKIPKNSALRRIHMLHLQDLPENSQFFQTKTGQEQILTWIESNDLANFD